MIALPLVVASSCSAVGHEHVHSDVTSSGRPDAVIAGPQGAVPQFIAECRFSHAAADDPIVHPGSSGAGHLHVFFGNPAVDADSTTADLVGGSTTCDQPLDAAAYWTPALLRDGTPVVPTRATAYYRAGVGVDHRIVQPYPPGLVMIAGNAGARGPQPLSIVAWGCGLGSERSELPLECPGARPLRLLVTFPDCWDGEHLDSHDHHAHVAYSTAGACPSSHPVPVPQLQLAVEFPVSGGVVGLELASGGLFTGHADFMNGWDQDKLAHEVASCLNRGVVCGIASE